MKQSKKFRLSYPELAQRGDRVQVIVGRDIEIFIQYGYSETIADTVGEKTANFKQIEPDMFWEGQKVLTTNDKELCKEKLIGLIGEIGFKAKLALGADSKEYKMFRISGMKNMDDNELVSYGKHVCKTTELFMTKLATRNVTAEILTEAQEATIALDNAIDTQTEAIAVREQKSLGRLELGNELYDLIVELCEVGKRIWENKNEAFYHDYVLYSSNKSAEAETDDTDIELAESETNQ